jgi:hypothetical protein
MDCRLGQQWSFFALWATLYWTIVDLILKCIITTAAPRSAAPRYATHRSAAHRYAGPRSEAPRSEAPRSEASRSAATRSEVTRSAAPRSAVPRSKQQQPTFIKSLYANRLSWTLRRVVAEIAARLPAQRNWQEI